MGTGVRTYVTSGLPYLLVPQPPHLTSVAAFENEAITSALNRNARSRA